MKWTKEDRFNTCISIIESFMSEFKAIVDFAQKEDLSIDELWMGYCEQRKEII